MADRILVTGATGFLGGALVAQLAAAGASVRAFVRDEARAAQLRALGAELACGDVRDAASVAEAMAGCAAVIHAAGLFRLWGEAAEFERTNVEGTAYVIQAALRCGVRRLVHISSVAVVGLPPPGQVIDEFTPSQPADPYQRSKLDGENLVRMFHQTARLPAVILRPGAYYGPGGHYAFNRLFFEDPLRGLLVQVHGGRRLAFPVFVPDVARVAIAALSRGEAGQVYNVAGLPLAHREINRTVSRLAGLPPWRVNVPERAMLALARRMAAQAARTGREPFYPPNLAHYVFHDWNVSSARAQAALGFAPTPFAEGARQTLHWLWSKGGFRPLPWRRAAARRAAAAGA